MTTRIRSMRRDAKSTTASWEGFAVEYSRLYGILEGGIIGPIPPVIHSDFSLSLDYDTAFRIITDLRHEPDEV